MRFLSLTSTYVFVIVKNNIHEKVEIKESEVTPQWEKLLVKELHLMTYY